MAGLPLEHTVTLDIPSRLRIGNRQYRLWDDPKYSKITFSTPDILERSLMEAVSEGRAQYALDGYLSERGSKWAWFTGWLGLTKGSK
jgi:hypothetical protein